ncbi:MAG: sodium:alanine symporter family protein [Synergistales bacterium]|nr:sodium:alanine symporter family protein [Synergistales bacterium]
METIMQINGFVNSIVWGPWMITLLLGTGVYLTFVLGFPQIRYFVFMFKEVFGKLGKKAEGEGSITSFGALATALASTLGSGNIAGAATAVHLGGPGALFWMLVTAVFGMTTKFAEVTLAVHYRGRDEEGNWRGGTMYVLERGTGQKWLAWLFAFFAMFAAFGIGNAIQANSVAEATNLAFGIPHYVTGIIIAVLIALVIVGGITRIAEVTTYLVPFMAVFYFIGAGVILVLNADMIGDAWGMAVKYAFHDPRAVPGAVAGWSIKMALTKGVARGIFSNEAGLGSAPMVHSSAVTDHPCRQATYGLFEVFLDTIVVCTMTITAIMVTGVLTSQPDLTGAQLTLSAFETVMGQTGIMILSIGLAMFAFSTILGWYWYGDTSARYIFGPKVKHVYRALWIIVIFVGAAGGGGEFLGNIWNLSDTMNGLMAAPNLVALLWMSKKLLELRRDFDSKLKSGELK